MQADEEPTAREGVMVDQWGQCYAAGWPKELLVPEAFAHPAKFAYTLIQRIYAHAREEGWMPPGSKVLDPFAGVSLGALEALRLGCAWVGCELEPRFYLTGMSNIAKWMHEYRHLPGWGPWAMVVNGDSRHLLEALGHVPAQLSLAVSSPPHTGGWHKAESTAITEARMRKAGYSEEYIATQFRASKGAGGNLNATDYGTTPGQLGAMPVADIAVASPPFAATTASDWHLDSSPERFAKMYANYKANGGGMTHAQFRAHCEKRQEGYGHTAGQLSALAVSSPPYVDSVNAKDNGIDWSRMDGGTRDRTIEANYRTHGGSGITAQHYGTTEGQLGAMTPGMVVSSPPFVDARQNTTPSKKGKTAPTQHDPEAFGTTPGNLASLSVSSPPYAATDTKPHALGTGKGTRATGESADRNKGDYHYGETPGNLAHLSVSSPPYSTSTQVNNHPQDMTAGKARWAGGTDSAARVKQDYVEPSTPGNLSHMPALAVSSPPYADGCGQQGHDYHPERMVGTRTGYIQRDHAGYGESHGQLATEEATTFWSAARTVVAQTFALLRPGGHAIWVVKAYVREKKIVDFPGQWRAMCESVGFVTLHEHHAMLVEEHGEQGMLFGTASDADTAIKEGRASVGSTGKMFLGKAITTERKSFFRRLAEKKGSPRINFEVVLCMFKPSGDSNGVDLCTSSPPYSVGLGKEHTYADHTKRDRDSHRRIMTEKHIADPFYGTTEGNLGNLPDDASTKSRKRPRKPRVVQESAPAQDHRHD